MMEEFKIIKREEQKNGTLYIYTFKLKEQLFYAYYHIYPLDNEIGIGNSYYINSKLEWSVGSLTDELKGKIKINILKQKEIRLRHLFNPYKFI